ncbi:hypothetical protein [Chitinibacter tainanensis]|uniref:hypothetical protein n=1 Tax=Chitinibacter tainanensis TaxID=230667 RepID=UPI002355BB7F|nr:hypothetical protein [Chitinibacter tainanensis]
MLIFDFIYFTLIFGVIAKVCELVKTSEQYKKAQEEGDRGTINMLDFMRIGIAILGYVGGVTLWAKYHGWM